MQSLTHPLTDNALHEVDTQARFLMKKNRHIGPVVVVANTTVCSRRARFCHLAFISGLQCAPHAGRQPPGGYGDSPAELTPCTGNLHWQPALATKTKKAGSSKDDPAFRFLVGARGFEPPTPASRTQYSTGLSYAPTVTLLLIGRLASLRCRCLAPDHGIFSGLD
jgi:hypothetical protein